MISFKRGDTSKFIRWIQWTTSSKPTYSWGNGWTWLNMALFLVFFSWFSYWKCCFPLHNCNSLPEIPVIIFTVPVKTNRWRLLTKLSATPLGNGSLGRPIQSVQHHVRRPPKIHWKVPPRWRQISTLMPPRIVPKISIQNSLSSSSSSSWYAYSDELLFLLHLTTDPLHHCYRSYHRYYWYRLCKNCHSLCWWSSDHHSYHTPQ